MLGSEILGEFLGTFVLILLGDGVVAGVLLEKSKSKGSGWIVITAGWAFAVVIGVFVAKAFGSNSAHLNPAVTIGFAILEMDPSKILSYIPAQLLGAFFGAVFVFSAITQLMQKTYFAKFSPATRQYSHEEL